MKMFFRWLGFSLAALASFGMVLIPASPADAAISAHQRQLTLQTYSAVVESLRSDPALYAQLTSQQARLSKQQYLKLMRHHHAFMRAKQKLQTGAADLNSRRGTTDFSSQSRPAVVVTPAPAAKSAAPAAEKAKPPLEMWRDGFKAAPPIIALLALLFPPVAVISAVVVVIQIILDFIIAIGPAVKKVQDGFAAARR